MPALEHIVIEGGPCAGDRARAFDVLWGRFGGEVRVVELEPGGDGEGGTWMDDVREIVNACPELEVLNFRIGCGHLNGGWSPMDDPDFVGNAASVSAAYMHDTLQRLGVCVDSDAWSVNTWMALAEFVGEWKLYVQNVQAAEQNPQLHLFHGELALSGGQLLLHSVPT